MNIAEFHLFYFWSHTPTSDCPFLLSVMDFPSPPTKSIWIRDARVRTCDFKVYTWKYEPWALDWLILTWLAIQKSFSALLGPGNWEKANKDTIPPLCFLKEKWQLQIPNDCRCILVMSTSSLRVFCYCTIHLYVIWNARLNLMPLKFSAEWGIFYE